jgi:hypothetical protein
MTINLSDFELSEAAPITDKEMLQEANAWGFDTVEEMFTNMDEAMKQADIGNNRTPTKGLNHV